MSFNELMVVHELGLVFSFCPPTSVTEDFVDLS